MSLPEKIVLESGRTLYLKEVDPGDMLDLIEAAGSAMRGDSSSAWLAYAQTIATVARIDDRPFPFPTTKEEVRALARLVGNDGLEALHEVLNRDEDSTATDKAVAKN